MKKVSLLLLFAVIIVSIFGKSNLSYSGLNEVKFITKKANDDHYKFYSERLDFDLT